MMSVQLPLELHIKFLLSLSELTFAPRRKHTAEKLWAHHVFSHICFVVGYFPDTELQLLEDLGCWHGWVFSDSLCFLLRKNKADNLRRRASTPLMWLEYFSGTKMKHREYHAIKLSQLTKYAQNSTLLVAKQTMQSAPHSIEETLRIH